MRTSRYLYTSQAVLRRAFWLDHPSLRPQYRSAKRQNAYPCDTRIAWCDYVEAMARDGNISDALAGRATL
jgi:hypothetical protein